MEDYISRLNSGETEDFSEETDDEDDTFGEGDNQDMFYSFNWPGLGLDLYSLQLWMLTLSWIHTSFITFLTLNFKALSHHSFLEIRTYVWYGVAHAQYHRHVVVALVQCKLFLLPRAMLSGQKERLKRIELGKPSKHGKTLDFPSGVLDPIT